MIATPVIPTPALAEQIKVSIPAGTPIDLKFTNMVSPEFVTMGQQVDLTVDSPLVIDGVKVVEFGAKAVAEVVQAQKRGGVGKAAIIGVILKRVMAVDGSWVPLEGRLLVEGKGKQTSSILITVLCCILGLLQKGGKAEIAAGTSIAGTTITTSQVVVEQ